MAYPPKPVKRDSFGPIFLVICFPVFSWYCWYHGLAEFSVNSIICLLPFLIQRVILFTRELILYRKLYRQPGDHKRLFLRVATMENWHYFVSIFLIIFTVFIYNGQLKEILDNRRGVHFEDGIILVLLFANALYFRWEDCPLIQSYKLEEPSKFSGGAAMAFGFYYGYLKMIITDKNLVKNINAFLNQGNIKPEHMPEKKLFILIPSSSKIPNEHMSNRNEEDNLEHVPNALQPIDKNRCLVIQRSYKCSMYTLRKGAKKYYLPLEGATPLRTFYETCQHNPALKEYNREVVSAFYHTLTGLIDADFEMKQFVELVYYDDEKNPNFDEVLIERLKYLKHQRKSKKR